MYLYFVTSPLEN